MDSKTLAIVGVVIVAALLLGVFTPGGFLSTGTIQSISQTTLNGKSAFLITMLGGSGADGLVGWISKNSFPQWTTDKGLTIAVFKQDDRYTYLLTERTSSAKTINKLTLTKECRGNDWWNTNACNYERQPFSFTFNSFKSYCASLNAGAEAYDTSPSAIDANWRCYVPTANWIVGDFNKVGGIFEPKVLITADIWNKDGNDPSAILEKHVELYLSRTNPQGTLITTTGENIGQVAITGMVPTFNSPPPSDAIKAVSPPSIPRSYKIVDGSIDTDAQLLINQKQTCVASSVSNYATGVYDMAKLTSCLNSFNAKVGDLLINNPPVGDFARSDIALDTSAINSNGTISIKNSFAIPQLTSWLYADSVGVTRPNAIPLSVSCQGKTLDGGVSSSLSASVVNSPLGDGIIYWTAGCDTPVTTTQGSGQVEVRAGQTVGFTIPIATGSQASDSSKCRVTAKSTDLQTSVSGTCNVPVKAACTTVVPPGCHLKEGCVLDCTVPPSICSDGTLVGQCNIQKKRCVNEGSQFTLRDDLSCAITPPKNDTTLSCLPFIQKVKTETVGGFLGIGATQVQTCENDLVGIGSVVLVVLGGLYLWRRKL